MKVGDLVKDQIYEVKGIIISTHHKGPEYLNGDKTDWHDFGVLYDDGCIYGADKSELEVINES